MFPVQCWHVCVLFLFACCAADLSGQPNRASVATPVLVGQVGNGTISLDGVWQFHLGDNSSWADPSFDDSRWEQLTADKPWGAQTHPGYTGFAWYRRHLQIEPVSADTTQFALLIDHIDSCYEVYWNGRLVGRNGKVPPHPVWDVADPAQTFGLGDAATGVLALRVWRAPLLSSDSEKVGGPESVPVLGTSSGISALKAQLDYQWLRARQYSFAQSTLYALVLVLSLIAWLRNPKERLLMWMSLFCAAPLILLADEGLHLRISFRTSEIWFLPAECMLNVSLWFVLLGLLELREDPAWARITRMLAWIDALSSGLDSVLVGGSWWANSQGSGFLAPADWTLTAIYTLLDLYPLVLLAVAIRRRHGKRLDRSRWLVAIFACLSGLIATSTLDLSQGQRFTHWTLADRVAAPLFSVSGNEFTPQAISDSLLLIAIIYALLNYTREASRRQTALEQEHRNARAVQQVLIPEEIPQVPGFAIHSFYKPAGEVGGDFFQIFATGDGGVLAVIGDVSGKGMPAAMTVSLLVGTVRTLAHYTHSPGAILAAMNQRMLGRSQGGFTTCLVLRADMNGALTIANAGHIAPYVAGKELALEGGLPLGLSEETSYVESVFHLAPEEQLTLLTDGVVEAREKTGALFGFERTAALSTQPAEVIALAAQAFGQDDDITVLSLTRLANDEKSAAPVTSPILSPA